MSPQIVVFRADASIKIGTGHVMRCLTLADALRDCGAICYFVCRLHEGHLLDVIKQRGHLVISLPAPAEVLVHDGRFCIENSYDGWLGDDWIKDAWKTHEVTKHLRIDWLVVDHYAIDSRWEKSLRKFCQRVFVIDDLANREHDCDLLLDQTCARAPRDYQSLVPKTCVLLCGAAYAMLRPEFAAKRTYSLRRRAIPKLEQVLVTMGGVDKDNATGKVLSALTDSPLPQTCKIIIVMGGRAPWLKSISQQANSLTRKIEVRVDVKDMAQLMAESDVAMGAAGSTSWERCCLGLPSLMFVLADNQHFIAHSLESLGAAKVISNESRALQNEIALAAYDNNYLKSMSERAAQVCDGLGIFRVVERLVSML